MFAKSGLSFKLRIGFGTIVLLVAVVGGLGWFGVDKLYQQLKAFSFWVDVDTVMNSTITANVTGLKYEIEIYTDSPTRDRFDALVLSLEQVRKSIENWQNRFSNNTEIEKTATQALRFRSDLEAAAGRFQQMFDTLQLGNTFEVVVEMQQANEAMVKVFSTAMTEIINPAKEQELIEASAIHQQIFRMVLGLIVCGILLGIYFSLRITRNLTKPILQAIEDLTIEAENGKNSSMKFSETSHQLADAAYQQSAVLEETTSMTRQSVENDGAAKLKMSEVIQIVQKMIRINTTSKLQ